MLTSQGNVGASLGVGVASVQEQSHFTSQGSLEQHDLEVQG